MVSQITFYSPTLQILNWGHNRYQQLEGTLNELCEHNLPAGETKEQLLNERGNSVAFWQVEPLIKH